MQKSVIGFLISHTLTHIQIDFDARFIYQNGGHTNTIDNFNIIKVYEFFKMLKKDCLHMRWFLLTWFDPIKIVTKMEEKWGNQLI